ESLEKAMAAVEGGVEKALERIIASSRKKLGDHATSLVKDLDSAAQSFGTELAGELEGAQKSADALAGILHRRLDAAREQYVLMESAVEERLRQVTGQMYKRLEETDRRADADPILAIFPKGDLSKLDEASQ